MKKIIIFIFIVSFIFSCGNEIQKESQNGVLYIKNPKDGKWQSRTDDPIKLKLEITYGRENEPIEETFSRISNVFTDNDGNVYIFDSKDNRFVSYSKKGDFIWSKGRRGKGPGEFHRVNGVVFDGTKYFYFGNLSGNRIDKFDLNGNFIKSFNLVNFQITHGKLIGFIQPNILILQHYKDGKVCVHFTFLDWNDSPKVKSEIYIEEDIGIKLPMMLSLDINHDIRKDEIVLGSNYTYKLSYYNLAGDLKKVITRDFDKIIRPGVESGENYATISYNGELSAPIKLIDNYEVCFLAWPINASHPEESINQTNKKINFRNALDFYNMEGELLYSIYSDGKQNAEIGRPIHVDINNKLYTVVSDPFPQVRRFNVIIRK